MFCVSRNMFVDREIELNVPQTRMSYRDGPMDGFSSFSSLPVEKNV